MAAKKAKADLSSRSGQAVARKTPTRYDERTISEGLIAMALESGNSRRAAKRMTTKVAHGTLQRWVRAHAERYAELKRELLPKIREQAAEAQMAVAEEAKRVELKLLDRLDKESDDLPIRDVSTAARNSAVQQGIHLQRAMELRGDVQPTVNLNFDVVGMVRDMAAAGRVFTDENNNRLSPEEAVRRAENPVLESTSEEIEDGEQ